MSPRLSLLAALLACGSIQAAPLDEPIKVILSVGREGTGNPMAEAAWQTLSEAPVAELPLLIRSLQ
ncbi:MAG: hypothetical protein ABL994_09170, partial [Verrucomicrobiales bacterium]